MDAENFWVAQPSGFKSFSCNLLHPNSSFHKESSPLIITDCARLVQSCKINFCIRQRTRRFPLTEALFDCKIGSDRLWRVRNVFSNRARAVFDRRLIAFKRLRIFAVFVRFSRRFGCLTSQCGWAACLLIRLFGAFPRLGRMHPFRNAPVITSAPVFMRPAVIFLTSYSLRQSVVFLPAATICRPAAVC